MAGRRQVPAAEAGALAAVVAGGVVLDPARALRGNGGSNGRRAAPVARQGSRY